MTSGEYEKIYNILAVYYHFYNPGSSNHYTVAYRVKLEDLRDIIDAVLYGDWVLKNSRRWLPKGEAPFPGYCRAPGSVTCLPVLCNCKKLTEIWHKIQVNSSK